MASFFDTNTFFSPINAALEYISWDPNEETKRIIQKLSEKLLLTELNNILSTRLQFGTAGLRGPMGAGYNRMNDLVILQTTQGLCRYLDSVDDNAKNKGVIIGYDHRSLGSLSSKGFARISAAVFLSQGYKVYLLEDYVPTPFVAYGIKHLNCAAGIMVTASHNPKQDNGFKVYWGNGSQIVPPHDNGIANAIEQNLKPWQEGYNKSDEYIKSHPLVEDVTERIACAYFKAISTLSDQPISNNNNEVAHINHEKTTPIVKAVYTAMHGVGCRWVKEAFIAFNHPALDPVPIQALPDPTFPTVLFPNPEEKGALDQAILYANMVGADLILANDPDADRLAVAERVVSIDGSSNWYIFTGNELGVILGHCQLSRWKKKHLNIQCPPAALLASVVSSRMLKTIALAENMYYYDTLTGFKWLGDCAIKLREQDNIPVIFAYEEALGYCLGDIHCDKDGISAAAVFYELATMTRIEKGWSMRQYLQDLYKTYGEFVSYNSYVISHDKAVTQKIFDRLRGSDNKTYWTECVNQKIIAIHDVTMGYDSSTIDKKSALPTTPDSQMIMYSFDNGISVTLRTSGTEPKIKYYTEIAGKPGQSREYVEEILHTFVDALVEEMLQPHIHCLAKP